MYIGVLHSMCVPFYVEVTMKTLAIGILTYNRKELLGDTLKSLFKFISHDDMQVLLIDNGSSKEFQESNQKYAKQYGLIYIYTKQYNRAQIIFKQLLNDHDNDVTLWRFYYMSVAITGDYLRALQINYDAISKFQDNKSLWKDYHYFETKVDKIEKQNLRESFDKSYKKGSNFKNSTLDDFF